MQALRTAAAETGLFTPDAPPSPLDPAIRRRMELARSRRRRGRADTILAGGLLSQPGGMTSNTGVLALGGVTSITRKRGGGGLLDAQ